MGLVTLHEQFGEVGTGFRGQKLGWDDVGGAEAAHGKA